MPGYGSRAALAKPGTRAANCKRPLRLPQCSGVSQRSHTQRCLGVFDLKNSYYYQGLINLLEHAHCAVRQRPLARRNGIFGVRKPVRSESVFS